jgi:hypothetical protein
VVSRYFACSGSSNLYILNVLSPKEGVYLTPIDLERIGSLHRLKCQTAELLDISKAGSEKEKL